MNKNTLNLGTRLDFESHRTFRDQLTKALHGKPQVICIDMSSVEFMDSSGMGMLLLANQEALQQDCKVELLRPQGQVRDIIELAHIDRVMTVTYD